MTSQELALFTQDDASKVRSESLVIDSLPYVDTIHEDYEEFALALIEEEMQTFEPPKIRKIAPIRYRSDLMRTELDSLINVPSRSKPLVNGSSIKSPSVQSIQEWKDAVSSARAKYEAERQRSMILEIEKSDVSAQQWKHYSSMVLEEIQGVTQTQLEKQKIRVDLTNTERQQLQQKAGYSLLNLTNQWQQLARKKFELEMATCELGTEVSGLREQRFTTDKEKET